MSYTNFCRTIFCILLIFFAHTALAWDHSIGLSYGRYHDPNNVHYYNSGYFLSGDVYSLHRTPWTYWSLNGALGQWHSTAPTNNNLTTAALGLALRVYPYAIAHQYPTYLMGSVSPAYLSKREFGTNTQGMNFAFQSYLGLGAEFKNIDVGLRFVHYSNAGLATPNEGFNFYYLFTLGYLFC